MTKGFTDWAELGYLIMQDHDPRRGPVAIRKHGLVGGRLVKMRDPEDTDNPAETMQVLGKEGVGGTAGDLWPTMFWQTVDRGKRGMGSWGFMFAGLTVTAVL